MTSANGKLFDFTLCTCHGLIFSLSAWSVVTAMMTVSDSWTLWSHMISQRPSLLSKHKSIRICRTWAYTIFKPLLSCIMNKSHPSQVRALEPCMKTMVHTLQTTSISYPFLAADHRFSTATLATAQFGTVNKVCT